MSSLVSRILGFRCVLLIHMSFLLTPHFHARHYRYLVCLGLAAKAVHSANATLGAEISFRTGPPTVSLDMGLEWKTATMGTKAWYMTL